eukprot:9783004-Ditylum_brightwellii.AAC.1
MERRFRRAIGKSCSKKKATMGGTSEDFIPPLQPTKQMIQIASADLSNRVKIGTTIVRNSILRAWPARHKYCVS